MSERGSILVTGGAGYIGAQVCKALAAAGYRPVVLDDLSSGERRAARFGPFHEGDLRDAAALARVLDAEAVDAVVHLAGLINQPASFAAAEAYHAVNVAASEGLLAAMAARGIRRLVFASSAAVYGEPAAVDPARGIAESQPAKPGSPYALSKYAIEKRLAAGAAEAGLRYLALRFFNAAGADRDGSLGENHREETHLIPLAIRAATGLGPALTVHGSDFPTPDGTAIRDYVHVEDLAVAHLAGLAYLEAGGASRVLNLGAGHGTSVRQVIDQVAAACGRPVPFATGPRRPGDAAVLVADIAEARRVLGWQPRLSDLATIVASAAAWETGGRRQA
ncbi:MAG: UDP-glucose 4-epimerase GalE [Kiloniellaceae bacterium]